MKFVALLAVPPGVVTEILPVVAPEGTVAVILVEELRVNAAASPLNRTEDAPLNVLPSIVTLVPACPEAGVKPVIWGSTKKVPTLEARPAGLVTLILPVVAPGGTLTVIWVGELIEKALVVVLLKVTTLAAPKLVPVMATELPTAPLPGLNPVTVGGRMTVKSLALVTVPPELVTMILPVVVPALTLAVI